MGRAPCCDKANVKRGPWSPEEDATLKTFLETHGTAGNWIALPKKAGLRRCGKSCRLRWLNYLRPDIKHGGFTEEEDNIICTLYGQMGSRWSAIASQLAGRTDNDVKNYWNTKLKKKIMAGKVGIKNLTENDTHPSTQLLTQNATKTQNSDYPAPQNQNSLPSLVVPSNLGTTNDANLGINITDQIHPLYSSRDMDVHNVGAISSSDFNNPMLSLSHQEGSSNISDSNSSIAINTKCVPQPEHATSDESMLMDLGFGFPYDLVNGPNCHERIGEFAPSWYPEWVDFSYADINKPH